ncbi:TetR/AcrR family transcriptional regulator [Desulfobacterales bacterium HSG17]|nr:TetR/AcrR family transcriptional regulator [Desulfobacterales bacterium HSG17]
MFARKGYKATSVSDIAAAAGIGKGTVYAYFKNKRELFIAAIQKWYEQNFALIRTELAQIDHPEEKLKCYIFSCEKLFVLENKFAVNFFLEVLRQTLFEDGILHHQKSILQEILYEQTRFVADILLNGISQGVFKPEIAPEVENIASSILAFLDGMEFRILAFPKMMPWKEQIINYVDSMLSLIRLEP